MEEGVKAGAGVCLRKQEVAGGQYRYCRGPRNPASPAAWGGAKSAFVPPSTSHCKDQKPCGPGILGVAVLSLYIL